MTVNIIKLQNACFLQNQKYNVFWIFGFIFYIFKRNKFIKFVTAIKLPKFKTIAYNYLNNVPTFFLGDHRT